MPDPSTPKPVDPDADDLGWDVVRDGHMADHAATPPETVAGGDEEGED